MGGLFSIFTGGAQARSNVAIAQMNNNTQMYANQMAQQQAAQAASEKMAQDSEAREESLQSSMQASAAQAQQAQAQIQASMLASQQQAQQQIASANNQTVLANLSTERTQALDASLAGSGDASAGAASTIATGALGDTSSPLLGRNRLLGN